MQMRISLVGLAGCVFDWIFTRPWKTLILYFLPLLLAISTVGLAATGNWLNRDALATRYLVLANAEVDDWEKQWAPKPKSTAQDANARADASGSSPQAPAAPASISSETPKTKEIPASAEMLFRRVLQLQQNDSRSIFFVALSYLQRGAASQGLNMLNRIAPIDRIGYPPAHAFLVERMLSQPIKLSDVALIRHHAEGAMQWDSISPQLLAQISDLYAKLNEPDKSMEAINKAAERDQKYYLLLGQMGRGNPKYKNLTNEAIAKAHEHFSDVLARNPTDIGARLMLADAQRLQSNMKGAEQTILDGMKLSDSPILKSALSQLYHQVFVQTSQFKDNNWTGDIELLEKAFRLDPNNLSVFEEVAKLARVSGTTPNEELMTQLRKNLAEGRATSVTHMWIAEHYLNSNQFAKAVPHLEQAVKRDPTASRCWNNLAYCIADLDPSRLEEALQYVDRAIALAPMMPDYHDTRGTILMKMKRPGDAIAAFERAIEAITNAKGALQPQPDYHKRLAEAYAAVGDNAMADTHKQFAANLVKALAKAREEAKLKSPNASAAPAAEPGAAVPGSAVPDAATKEPSPGAASDSPSRVKPEAVSEPQQDTASDNSSTPPEQPTSEQPTSAKPTTDESTLHKSLLRPALLTLGQVAGPLLAL